MRWAFFLLLTALGLAMSSCATVASVSSEPLTDGLTRPYPYPMPFVVQAARASILRSNYDIEKDEALEPQTWMIVATRGVSLWSWGEVVRLVIVAYPWTTVTVYAEPRMATNVAAMDTDDFAAELFPEIAAELARLGAPDLRYSTPAPAPAAALHH